MNELIQSRLDSYKCQSDQAEKNAIKEITQEVTLYCLSKAGFFEVVGFQGGTALRILYGLNRFSEDLDFALVTPDQNFEIEKYIKKLTELMNSFGYELRVTGRNHAGPLKSRFIKEDSVGKVVEFKHIERFGESLKIKVEVDTNPPAGATYEIKYLDFPLDFSVRAFDQPSLFAGKVHALLCRDYVKGRDWYDFSWYVARRTMINFELLSKALDQMGPWKGKGIAINRKWLVSALRKKVSSIDWKVAIQDVGQFLNQEEQEALSLWSVGFFNSKLEKLHKTLWDKD